MSEHGELTSQIGALTQRMREDADPQYVCLRDELRRRGLDPEETVLAEYFQDEVDLAYGIVCDKRGEVHEFDLTWPLDGAGQVERARGRVTKWIDHTRDWWKRPHAATVREALRLLAHE